MFDNPLPVLHYSNRYVSVYRYCTVYPLNGRWIRTKFGMLRLHPTKIGMLGLHRNNTVGILLTSTHACSDTENSIYTLLV